MRMAGVVLTNDELCDELDCPRGSSLTWDKNGSGSWLLRITSENLPQKFEAGPNSMLKCTTLAKWRGQIAPSNSPRQSTSATGAWTSEPARGR